MLSVAKHGDGQVRHGRNQRRPVVMWVGMACPISGGVLKNTGCIETRHVFEEYPPPGRGPGSAPPQPRCLMRRGVPSAHSDPRANLGVVHRLPSRPLPLGRGCDRTVGTGEVVPPPGVIPQAAGADDGRSWTLPLSPSRGGRGVRCRALVGVGGLVGLWSGRARA